MKKFLYPLIALVSVFVLWGCPQPEPQEDDVLTPDKSEYTIEAAGGEFTISYRTNLECQVRSDASWLTVATKTKAVTTKSQTVVAKANTSTEARKATLTIEGGKLKIQVTINQKGVEPSIVINGSTSVNVPAEGGNITVDVTSNVAYTVSVNGSWLHAAGSSNGIESFTADANESEEGREGSVTFSYGSVSRTVTVSQAGKEVVPEEPYLTVTPSTIDAPAAGGQYNITVSTNVQYSATPSANWLRIQNGKVVVEENTATEARSAKIQFASEQVSAEITVNQAAKEKEQPYINVDVPQFDIAASSAIVTVHVTSNIEYQTTISAGWVTNAGNGNFNVAANESSDARSATITFSGEGITKTVTINQQGKGEEPPVEEDVLINGGAATYDVSADGGTIEVVIRTNVDYTVNCSAEWIKQANSKTVREETRIFAVEANTGEARMATINVTYGSGDSAIGFTVTVKQEAYVAPGEDPFFEVNPKEATISYEGGDLTFTISTNCTYKVTPAASWVSVKSKSETACVIAVSANTETKARSVKVRFSNDEDEFDSVQVSIIQDGSPIDEDPFDVGSNLSINGTANCYVVTKAGDFSFDASVMGNGPEGVLWSSIEMVDFHLWPHGPDAVYMKNSNITPSRAYVIWDDNNVVTDVKYNTSNRTITFKATGNKGNALIGLYDRYATEEGVRSDSDEALWSWHIWCTDSPQQLIQYDVIEDEYIILDRNLGATSANPADGRATWGYYYQFGRKDPMRPYVGIAVDMKEAPHEMVVSVQHPTQFYKGSVKCVEWFNNSESSLATVTADLWGNPFMKYCSTLNSHPSPAARGELKKTIYDPCPPGYMVPPETTWNAIIKDDVQLTDDGIIIPTASGDSFYPFSGYISPLNTSESPQNLGWFAFKGWKEMGYGNTHDDGLFAGAYTSCTGYVPEHIDEQGRHVYGPSLPSSYMYGFYMAFTIMKWDPYTFDFAYFDSVFTRPRVYGMPVRCVKQFNK